MKIKLTDTDGNVMVAKLAHPQCDHVVIDSARCLVCGLTPFKARGVPGSLHTVDDRVYVADAICLGCGANAGTLRAYPDTLFGIEEDEAVLNGRCRVY